MKCSKSIKLKGAVLTLEISVYKDKNNLDGHIFDGEIKALREASKVASSYDWGTEVTAESKKVFGYRDDCVATIGNIQIGQLTWAKRNKLVAEIEKELIETPLYIAYKQQEQKKAISQELKEARVIFRYPHTTNSSRQGLVRVCIFPLDDPPGAIRVLSPFANLT